MASDVLFTSRYRRTTKYGDLNLIGAIDDYFIPISNDHNVQMENRVLYQSDYINVICPEIDPDIPITEYGNIEIDTLSQLIKTKHSISDVTFNSRHKHLILDPIEYCLRDMNIDYDANWGSPFNLNESDLKQSDTLMSVLRCFNDEEGIALYRELLSNPNEISGEEAGIIIINLAGSRLNEACGVSYNDIHEMNDYSNEFIIQLGDETTKKNSNKLKLSGKTYNAPRKVPLLDKAYEALNERLDYITFMYRDALFPIVSGDEVYKSVLDFPIACRGDNYLVRASSNDVSRCCRQLFRDKLHFSEKEISKLGLLLLKNREDFFVEKDATCYTCRRDFDTELAIAFNNSPFKEVFIQYLQGHKIVNDLFKRSDFITEEYLHDMKVLLESSHPVNWLDWQ